MEEVLTRRFKRWKAAKENTGVGKKTDPSFGVLPDLLVVDGGKGQLSRAVKVLKEFELETCILAAGLAKQHELIFLPDRDIAVELPRGSQGLFLMQRIRDEAHRFAITAHRSRRKREKLISRLDQIPGIGPERRKALLKKFGSVKAIGEATAEDLSEISGITSAFASDILKALNKA